MADENWPVSPPTLVPARPSWAWAAIWIGWLRGRCGRDKTRHATLAPITLAPFPPLPFVSSSHAAASECPASGGTASASMRARLRELERRRRWRGPLAGACARPRLHVAPSSGSWPTPSSPPVVARSLVVFPAVTASTHGIFTRGRATATCVESAAGAGVANFTMAARRRRRAATCRQRRRGQGESPTLIFRASLLFFYCS